PSDSLRIGLLVDPVERRDAPPLKELGDPLVGEDHQVLDELVGLGLEHRPGADHGSVAVELELGLERLDLERSDGPAGGERRRGPTREAERIADGRRRLGPAGEELVELVVVEAGVRAYAAAVKARRPRATVAVQDD